MTKGLKKLMRIENKTHECNLCLYSCDSAAHLKKHMRKHSGEKPFHCTLANDLVTSKDTCGNIPMKNHLTAINAATLANNLAI